MRPIQLSGSSLWRAAICPGSAVLERVPEVSEWAERGTGIHGFLYDVATIGRDAALSKIADATLRAACDLIDVSRLPVDPTKYAAEVAYAYDVETGRARELGRNIGRRYVGLAPTEIPVTLDVVALVGDDAVYYGDYKGPWQQLPDPDANWQFRFGALAAARATHRTRALVEMIRIRDGEPYRTPGEFDLFDLAQIAEETRELHADVTRAAAADLPTLRIGAHCDGCECRWDCSARTSLIRASRDPDAVIVGIRRQLSPEHIEDAVGQAKAIMKLGEELLAECEGYALTHPVRMRDGSIYGPIEVQPTSPEGRAAWYFLAERVGEDEAWKRVKMTASWKIIESLAAEVAAAKSKESGKRVTIKSVMAEFEAELERRGAVKKGKAYDLFGPHSPGRWKKAHGELAALPPKELKP